MASRAEAIIRAHPCIKKSKWEICCSEAQILLVKSGGAQRRHRKRKTRPNFCQTRSQLGAVSKFGLLGKNLLFEVQCEPMFFPPGVCAYYRSRRLFYKGFRPKMKKNSRFAKLPPPADATLGGASRSGVPRCKDGGCRDRGCRICMDFCAYVE